MRTTSRFRFLMTIAFACGGLVLAACGPNANDSTSPEDDSAPRSSAPAETTPATPAIPANASVQAYCAAFRGEQTTMAGVDTTGEAADAYDDIIDNQREVGTPANMPEETRRVFIDYLQAGADFVAALRKLPEDSPTSAMRTNKDFYEHWGGKLETPKELSDYSAKNCT